MTEFHLDFIPGYCPKCGSKIDTGFEDLTKSAVILDGVFKCECGVDFQACISSTRLWITVKDYKKEDGK